MKKEALAEMHDKTWRNDGKFCITDLRQVLLLMGRQPVWVVL